MAYLPSKEASYLATKLDIDLVMSETDSIRTEIGLIRSDLSTMGDRIDGVNQRPDRLSLTLVAGLVSVFAQAIL